MGYKIIIINMKKIDEKMDNFIRESDSIKRIEKFLEIKTSEKTQYISLIAN